jgi:hypothetical protein
MTDQSFRGLRFGRDPNLRAADSDREATAERLRRGHAEGRLDTAELQQRLERCYEAKTLGELDELVTDLPGESVPDEPFAPRRLAPWRIRITPFLPLLIALVVICAATGRHAFWLLIPLVFVVSRMCWWRGRPSRMGGGRGAGNWI